MKKLMLLSFLLMATIFVNAQRRGGGNPEMRIEKRLSHLASELDLSTEQQAQLKEVFIEQHQSRKANGQKNRDLDSDEREAFKTERKAAKAEMDTKIAAILTPIQLESFQKLTEEKKGNRGRRGGAKGKRGREKATPEERAQKRTEKLTEVLDLDENQQAAIHDLFLEQKPRIKKGEWANLSPEEKQLLKENRQKDKANFDAELGKILTPAQLGKFQNLPKKERGKRNGKKNKN